MIRAAAKNYKDVLIVSSKNDYSQLLNLLNEKNGETSIDDRKQFAVNAFDISSHYDTNIHEYFSEAGKKLKTVIAEFKNIKVWRKPHQKGVFYGDLDTMFDNYMVRIIIQQLIRCRCRC